MRTRRFRAEAIPESGGITVEGVEARHMTRVLRLGPGDTVTLFDRTGMEADCVIEDASGGSVTLSILKRAVAGRLPGVEITVAACVPRAERMDTLIQKCAELGAKAVIPIIAERSVVLPRQGSKLQRWRRISSESSKQCGRNSDMEVLDPARFAEFVKTASSYNAALIADPAGRSLASAISRIPPSASVLAAVGPEGGFSPGELDIACRAGFAHVSLGRLTLRVETAAIALVAVLAYEESRKRGPPDV